MQVTQNMQMIFHAINPKRKQFFNRIDKIFCKFAIMIKRVYIDTSVFGGYFDKEFEKETRPFFGKIKEKKVKIIVSEILELELYRSA